MAKALKCDRCGMYYPIYKYNNAANSVRTIISNSEGIQLKVVRHYDLCKTCMDSLTCFMNIDGGEEKVDNA